MHVKQQFVLKAKKRVCQASVVWFCREMSSVFVTVGSTSFDALVSAACSEEVLQVLTDNGVEELVMQIGRGEPPLIPKGGKVRVRWFRYKPSLVDEISSAAFVVGHGGAGTVLECLSLEKPLVCVLNNALLHDHQGELVEQMGEEGRLRSCSPRTLADELRGHFEEGRKTPPPLNKAEPGMLSAYLEDFMGMR